MNKHSLKKGDFVFSIEKGYGWIFEIDYYEVPENLLEILKYNKQCVPRIKWFRNEDFPSCYSKPYRCGKKYRDSDYDLKYVEIATTAAEEELYDVDLGGFYINKKRDNNAKKD